MSESKAGSQKNKTVRKTFIWLVKPTLWRNSWNVDKEINGDVPPGMERAELFRTHQAMRERLFKENAIKAQLMEKLDKMSATEAFEFYVKAEKLSNEYLKHRYKSLKFKGVMSYLFAAIMVAVAINVPPVAGLISFIGKFIPFLLFFAFIAHGANALYRAEQIRQRRMFHFFEMFNSPFRLLM